MAASGLGWAGEFNRMMPTWKALGDELLVWMDKNPFWVLVAIFVLASVAASTLRCIVLPSESRVHEIIREELNKR